MWHLCLIQGELYDPHELALTCGTRRSDGARQNGVFSVVLVALAPPLVAQPIEKKGTTPYVTHFIFRPLMSIDIPSRSRASECFI